MIDDLRGVGGVELSDGCALISAWLLEQACRALGHRKAVPGAQFRILSAKGVVARSSQLPEGKHIALRPSTVKYELPWDQATSRWDENANAPRK